MKSQFIQTDMDVVVRYGGNAATPLCSFGTVIRRGETQHPDTWWVATYVNSENSPPLLQLFHEDDILGIASRLMSATHHRARPVSHGSPSGDGA